MHWNKNRIRIAFLFLMVAAVLVLSAGTPAYAVSPAPRSILNSFGEDPQTSRNFAWFTSTTAKTGFVEYCEKNRFSGFSGPGALRVAADNSTIQTDSDTRIIHKVKLTKLEPGTEYVYRVGIPGCYSPQGIFSTAGEETDSLTFLNMTDTQGVSAKDYAKCKTTLDKALVKFPDARFLVHTGDIVDTGYLIKQWDLFGEALQDELMNLPILPAVGNHDALNTNKTNGTARNFTGRFHLPDAGIPGVPAGTVYSAEYGNVHISVLNTQCGSSTYKRQAEWLRRDMAGSGKRWKVVAMHRGPYGATYDSTDIRKAWAPVFDELGIDLVLQGHDHNYVRSWPMKNDRVTAAGKGTVYVVGNSGGVKFYPLKARSWQVVDLQPRLPVYVAVSVSGPAMKIEAYDTNDTLLDAITLAKLGLAPPHILNTRQCPLFLRDGEIYGFIAFSGV